MDLVHRESHLRLYSIYFHPLRTRTTFPTGSGTGTSGLGNGADDEAAPGDDRQGRRSPHALSAG